MGKNTTKRRIALFAMHGLDRGPRSAAMSAEILVRNRVDLLFHGGYEVEVDGEDGTGAEERDYNAEGV